MNKKAFTIPEILIFMTIVGVICVAMITIIKPNEKFYKYGYYKTYDVLATVAYNIKEDAIEKKDENDPTTTAEDKKFPDNAKELCKKLASNPSAAPDSKDAEYGYINTSLYNCGNSFKNITKNGTNSEFSAANLAFKSTDSMNYYISADTAGKPFKVDVVDPLNGNIATPIEFFIVWVDLTGDRRPNTAQIGGNKRLPDVVPFVVTTGGKVLPIGIPTVELNYISARLMYPSETKSKYSPPTTYYQAQIMAYGNLEYPTTDVFSLRNSLTNFAKKTSMEIPAKLVPTVTNQDSECTPAATDSITACTITVEKEN